MKLTVFMNISAKNCLKTVFPHGIVLVAVAAAGAGVQGVAGLGAGGLDDLGDVVVAQSGNEVVLVACATDRTGMQVITGLGTGGLYSGLLILVAERLDFTGLGCTATSVTRKYQRLLYCKPCILPE